MEDNSKDGIPFYLPKPGREEGFIRIIVAKPRKPSDTPYYLHYTHHLSKEACPMCLKATVRRRRSQAFWG